MVTSETAPSVSLVFPDNSSVPYTPVNSQVTLPVSARSSFQTGTSTATAPANTSVRFELSKYHKRGRTQEQQRRTRLYGQWISDSLSQSSTLPGMPVTVSLTSPDGTSMPDIAKRVQKFGKLLDRQIGAGPAFGVSHNNQNHAHIVFLTWPEHVIEAMYQGSYHPSWFKLNQRRKKLPGTSTSLEQLALDAGFGRNAHARPTCELEYRKLLSSAGAPFRNRTGTYASYVLGPNWDEGMLFYRKTAVEQLTGVPPFRTVRGRYINAWPQNLRADYFAANRASGGQLDPATLGTTLVLL